MTTQTYSRDILGSDRTRCGLFDHARHYHRISSVIILVSIGQARRDRSRPDQQPRLELVIVYPGAQRSFGTALPAGEARPDLDAG